VLVTDVILWRLFLDVQRQRPVHAASQSDLDLPPQAEWESILAPLLTDFQRQLASPCSLQPETFHRWGVIWLRTCYDEGTDEVHRRLLTELNVDLALELAENILDDAALYDYGDDYRRIFEVAPGRLLEETLDDVDARDPPEERETRIREAQCNLDFDMVADTDA
jgi:GAF domain-containing protein